MNETYQVPYIYEKIKSHVQTLVTEVPGSKSITNRALLLATLAQGVSTLRGVLFSDDSRHFLKCIQELGFETVVDEATRVITVTGHGGQVPKKEASLYVGSAGTAARFLTSYLGLSTGIYHMDASPQMRKRPMAPLLDSLKALGCEISYPAPDDAKETSQEGFFPFTLHGHGFGCNRISVNIDHSSQFLSALMISSPLCPEDFHITIEGTHGMAYITMTAKMMEQFGVKCTQIDEKQFMTPAGQSYAALNYQIEPDVSAACYFYAMSPLLNIPVMVPHVHFDSLQGDVQFIRILEQMGCKAEDTSDGILVTPPESGVYQGIHADMHACSDQAITLAALAPFAEGPTTITGIGHIRFQESDRISAIVTELRKMGIRCEETQDSITIYPGIPSPATVDTYEDHRMAMGFSLIGLRTPGIVISDPLCCHKTFEDYFEVLDTVVKKLCD
ncbi:MAG: 3-phosphoshikimate 1-carboxyvinyltransferase [Lachnospiraceae bacterium]|nr:3-phosphoshikimate 1-carboxyvinyltransferase [Lachnospiraceae bacterium]